MWKNVNKGNKYELTLDVSDDLDNEGDGDEDNAPAPTLDLNFLEFLSESDWLDECLLLLFEVDELTEDGDGIEL